MNDVQKNNTQLNLNDPEQLKVLKEQIAKDCTDAELQYFAMVCARTGLDPFTRQIYAIKRDKKMTTQTSVDGFRLIAERTGLYEGQTQAQWCGTDGVWKDVWLSKEQPSAAKIGIYKKGFREPLIAVARFEAYAQTVKDFQTGETRLNTMWSKMGDIMIAKVAECLALRKSFPNDMSGIYGSEEMGQVDNDSYIEQKKNTVEISPKTGNEVSKIAVVSPKVVVDKPTLKPGEAPIFEDDAPLFFDDEPLHASASISVNEKRILSEKRVSEIMAYKFKSGQHIDKKISDLSEQALLKLINFLSTLENQTPNQVGYLSLLKDAFYYFFNKEF